MTFRGHIKNGQIALDEPVQLPDGTEVNVEVVGNGNAAALHQRRAHRIRIDAKLARDIASMPEFHPDGH